MRHDPPIVPAGHAGTLSGVEGGDDVRRKPREYAQNGLGGGSPPNGRRELQSDRRPVLHRHVTRHLWIAPWCYGLARAAGKVAFWGSVDLSVAGRENVPATGGCIIVCTHISHVEPACVSVVLSRKVDWMAREEFYRFRPFAWVLRLMDAFSVDRFGVPVSAIRTAVARAQMGRMVGIFPEGGLVRGSAFVCRGGPIKGGAFLVQQLAGVPMVPCVVLGTQTLTNVKIWIPFKRAKVQVAFGSPIAPPPPTPRGPQRREQRAEMTATLQAAMALLYAQLRQEHGISDADVP